MDLNQLYLHFRYIEELDDLSEAFVANADQLFAQMLAFFPEEAVELERLMSLYSEKLLKEQEAHHANTQTSTYKELVLVPTPMECTEQPMHTYIDELINSATPSGEATVERFDMKRLYRKISQRCHPDKCRKLDFKIESKLRQCFMDSRNAYDAKDIEELEFIFAKVCYLRHELERVPEYMQRTVYERLKILHHHFNVLRSNPITQVFILRREGDEEGAKSAFRVLLNARLAELRAELQEKET